MYLFCDNKYCKYHDSEINNCIENNHDCPYQKELGEKGNQVVIMNNDTVKNYEDLLVRAPYPPNSIALCGCEKIVLRQSGIDVKFELDNDNIRKFKQMYINGIGFVRSEAFCEELEDRLPEDIKSQVMEIILDLLEDWKQ